MYYPSSGPQTGRPLKGIYRENFPANSVDPFSTQNQSKWVQNALKWRREGVQRHRTAFSSVLVEYEPVGTHGGPIQTHFHQFSNIFWKLRPTCSKLFSKKWISRGSFGKSAKRKMIVYWSSNFHKFIIIWISTAFLHVKFNFFIKNLFFISSHLRFIFKEFRGAP